MKKLSLFVVLSGIFVLLTGCAYYVPAPGNYNPNVGAVMVPYPAVPSHLTAHYENYRVTDAMGHKQAKDVDRSALEWQRLAMRQQAQLARQQLEIRRQRERELDGGVRRIDRSLRTFERTAKSIERLHW